MSKATILKPGERFKFNLPDPGDDGADKKLLQILAQLSRLTHPYFGEQKLLTVCDARHASDDEIIATVGMDPITLSDNSVIDSTRCYFCPSGRAYIQRLHGELSQFDDGWHEAVVRVLNQATSRFEAIAAYLRRLAEQLDSTPLRMPRAGGWDRATELITLLVENRSINDTYFEVPLVQVMVANQPSDVIAIVGVQPTEIQNPGAEFRYWIEFRSNGRCTVGQKSGGSSATLANWQSGARWLDERICTVLKAGADAYDDRCTFLKRMDTESGSLAS